MIYNVGDKVLVRKDLVVEQKYSGCKFAVKMAHLRGKIATISRNPFTNRYYLDESGGAYFWSSEMFEGKMIKNRMIRND